MAVNFSSISGHPILHGCDLCNHLCNNLSCMAVCCYILSCMAVRLNHFWNNLSCMAVSSSSIHPSGILSCMTVSFSSISGTSYLAWLWHGNENFKHLWNTNPAWLSAVHFSTMSGHPILHGCDLFSDLWNNQACTAVSFSNISAASYPAWL